MGPQDESNTAGRVPTVPAKTIVTRTKNRAWFGTDYNMNLYRGCCHGCIYCDSRSSCYGIEAFDTVRIKENAIPLVAEELRKKRKKGVVGTGAMSDPYNPLEQTLKLTRQALALIQRYGFGVAIATKSPLVARDADVLLEIGRTAPAFVKFTLTTADDALCRTIEPHVAPTSARLAAMETLAGQGVCCGVLLMPLLPYINDTEENVLHLVHSAADAGAQFVYPGFGVTLRENQRAYFYQQLDRLFPGVKAQYQRQGQPYLHKSPRAQALTKAFIQACRARRLAYRMEDIIALTQRSERACQLSFFSAEERGL